MKLKTTIYGKPSTLIGTPEEVAEFLEVAHKKAIRRAVDVLPKPTSTTVHQTGFGGNVPTPKLTGQSLVEQIRTAAKTIQTPKSPFKPTFNAISQTREEIVKEAIADVAELLDKEYDEANEMGVVLHVGTVVDFALKDRIDFFINKEKRVVVAKLWIHGSTGLAKDEAYATTGIARCAPSDVFNEHVGKAIALRRALGLEVPAKYYEVGGIAPKGKQVGDVVFDDEDGVVLVLNDRNDNLPNGNTAHFNSASGKQSKVIDDSARYVAPSTPAAKVVYVGE